MSVLGQDYGKVLDVRGELEVEVFGSSPLHRFLRACAAFEEHLGLNASSNTVTLGVDRLDPYVERFRYKR